MAENANKSTTILLGGIIAVLLVIVAFLFWREGDRTRDAIKEGISEAAETTSSDIQKTVRREMKEGIKQGIDEMKDSVREMPSNVLTDLGKELGVEDADAGKSVIRELTGKIKDTVTKRSGGDLSELPDKLSSELTDRLDSFFESAGKAAAAGDKPDSSGGGAFGSFLNLAESAARTVDKVATGTQPDNQQSPIDTLVRQKLPLLEDRQIIARMRSLARSLVDPDDLKTKEFQFSLFDEDDLCAFSAPGGFVYVSKGMTDFAIGDEELQFVLGHQMALIESEALGVSYQGAYRAFKAENVSGEASINTFLTEAARPSGDAVAEADKQTFRWMSAIGRTNDQCLAYLRKASEVPGDPAPLPGAQSTEQCRIRLIDLQKFAATR